MKRRELLITSGLSLLTGKRAYPQVDAPAPAQQQTTPQSRLLGALQKNRLPLTMSDGVPAGRGWDWLVEKARDARFTLIGEEHGVAVWLERPRTKWRWTI